MRILITGNLGYVGSVLVPALRRAHPDWRIEGYDSGYFAHCLTAPGVWPETALDAQHFGDVRDLPAALLDGVDALVQLAAISNDPMGQRFEAVTGAINYEAVRAIALRARDAGVGRLVFASSCSIYGAAEDARARTETDPTNPLTAYARSKIATERALAALAAAGDLGGMTTTCLRFATACGMSPRLRLDLVLNDFVACALAAGEITVLSDGSPWRPLIDVADMARAIDWAATRDPSAGGPFLVVNAGSDAWNHQVRHLAHAVAAALPGTGVRINTAAPPDKRSYKVDFGLFRRLAPDHQPVTDLDRSIARLIAGLRAVGFANRDFRNSEHMRLRVLDGHLEAGRLDPDLRWRGVASRFSDADFS